MLCEVIGLREFEAVARAMLMGPFGVKHHHNKKNSRYRHSTVRDSNFPAGPRETGYALLTDPRRISCRFRPGRYPQRPGLSPSLDDRMSLGEIGGVKIHGLLRHDADLGSGTDP